MKTTTRKAEYDADIRKIIAETRAGKDFSEVAYSHWLFASPLFRHLSPNGKRYGWPKECGCLTQVKHGSDNAWTDEFTLIVQEDERIPHSPRSATPLSLFAFRELQMLADETFRRPYLLERGLIQEIEETSERRPVNVESGGHGSPVALK